MKPGRILIVDDDWFVRQVYADCLIEEGHRVDVAASGESALEALRRGSYDLVVTDLVMPGIGGLELLEFTKQTDASIDVIVMTSQSSVETAVRALRAGAYHYLVKPVDPEAIQLNVQRCLETRRLVAENKELRRFYRLFEVSQRIAACLDRDRLYALCQDALTNATGADATLLCEMDDGVPRAVAHRGVDAARASWLAEQLFAAHPEAFHTVDAPHELDDLGALVPARDATLRHMHRALIVPLRPEDAPPGVAVLLRRGADPPFPEEQQSDAVFLCRHIAVALTNSGRYVRVQNAAQLDSLTGLHNARHLDQVVQRELGRRQQSRDPFSLLFIDLDHFKQVNDKHGHVTGSKLLVEVGRLLKRCVREEDLVVRYGGDEFVALLIGTQTPPAVAVAERIRSTLDAHTFLAREGITLKITACVGVATWPEHARTRDEIIHRADVAMYYGKRGTRNTVYVFDEVPEEARLGQPAALNTPR